MSEEPLDIREQVARIDRAQAETRKFVAEHNKLAEEALKYRSEQQKLSEEALKFARERRWHLPVAILGNAALAAAIGALIAKLLH